MTIHDQLAHADEMISKFSVNNQPFEHYLVKDVFSPEFYQQILDHLPHDDAYTWGAMGREMERPRGLFTLNNASLAKLPEEQRELWTAVRDWMTSREFVERAMGKFHEQIERRFSEAGDDGRLFVEVKLVRDKSNYALAPHTDAPNRVTTLMMYLPKDERYRDLGTALYEPKQPDRTCEGLVRHSFDEFNLVGKAPFVPNSGMGFLKSERSFHGVEPFGVEDVQRDFLTFSIRCLDEKLRQRARRLVEQMRGNEQNYPISTRYL